MQIVLETVGGLTRRWYRADGPPDATPLLLIHGAGAAADTWVRNLDALAADRSVFAPDLLGHGFTDGTTHGDRAPQDVQLAHLLALIDHWGLTTFHVAGSSFGALLAALVYFARPEQVERLVLIGSASGFHPPTDQAGVLAGVLANQLKAFDRPTPETIRARNVGSNYDKADGFDEIVLVQLNYMALPDRKRFFQETIQGLIRTADSPEWRVYHRLEQIAAPTLVITGRDDPRADWRQVQESALRIPNAAFHRFDACGHKPFSERVERFNRVTRAFLAEA